MGAKLVLHDKVVLSLEEIVEIKIWKVPRSEEYPEGFKYSLVYVKKGKRILGYDNYQGHGHHKHIGTRMEPYRFKNVERLLEDFRRDLKEVRNEDKEDQSGDKEP